jgi:hypothetical protein
MDFITKQFVIFAADDLIEHYGKELIGNFKLIRIEGAIVAQGPVRGGKTLERFYRGDLCKQVNLDEAAAAIAEEFRRYL